MTGAAINLLPIIEIFLWFVIIGIGFAVACAVLGGGLFFLVAVLGAPFRMLSSVRAGRKVDEFDEVAVFWSGLVLIVVLVVLAFRYHVVTLK